ncbi:MAG: hypothetical protein ACLPN5_18400 [Roseiarcus sp.]
MSEAADFSRIGSQPAAIGEEFAVGRALSRAFSIFGQGFAKFLLLMAVAYLPVVLLQLLLPRTAGVIVHSSPMFFVRPVAFWFLQMIASAIGNAACLFGAYQIMRGEFFTFAQSLTGGLRRFGPVLGTSMLGGLLAGLATVLLLVPGVIVMCAIYVAIPACVIETLGPRASLERSRELTKGRRWAIFGLLLIVIVGAIVIQSGAGIVIRLVYLSLRSYAFWFQLAVSFAVQVFFAAFGAVLCAVVYHDLRVEREGIDVDQLAAVFE